MAQDNGHSEVDPKTIEALQRLTRSRGRSGRAAMARASAARTLERIQRQQPPPPPRKLYTWEDPTLDWGTRLRWLQLDLAGDMARALGWHIDLREWNAGSPRVAWLVAEAEGIAHHAEPFEAARAWIDEPPEPDLQ